MSEQQCEKYPDPIRFDGSEIDHIEMTGSEKYPGEITVYFKNFRCLVIGTELQVHRRGMNAVLETKQGSWMPPKPAA